MASEVRGLRKFLKVESRCTKKLHLKRKIISLIPLGCLRKYSTLANLNETNNSTEAVHVKFETKDRRGGGKAILNELKIANLP